MGEAAVDRKGKMMSLYAKAERNASFPASWAASTGNIFNNSHPFMRLEIQSVGTVHISSHRKNSDLLTA
jgi:hypothetical protein